jgi:hypothetical protein
MEAADEVDTEVAYAKHLVTDMAEIVFQADCISGSDSAANCSLESSPRIPRNPIWTNTR